MTPTPRELDVLAAFVIHGEKGAAEQLGIARSTVKNTLANVRSKIGARSSAHAAYLLARELRPRLS